MGAADTRAVIAHLDRQLAKASDGVALRDALNHALESQCHHLGEVDGASVWLAKDGSGVFAVVLESGALLDGAAAAELAVALNGR